jgi:hypothetical protein
VRRGWGSEEDELQARGGGKLPLPPRATRASSTRSSRRAPLLHRAWERRPAVGGGTPLCSGGLPIPTRRPSDRPGGAPDLASLCQDEEAHARAAVNEPALRQRRRAPARLFVSSFPAPPDRRQQGVGGAPHCDRALPRASAARERVGASPRASEAVLRVRALPRAAPPGDLELCRRRDSGGAGAARGAGVGRRRRREEREERGGRGEERWG